ncbi:MAG: aminoacyl-tRNA hydrolase [Muricauda sp.]|nr:aminoacyl-tRNA hydrolase [Allomuricauda sp.]MBO6531779.1 aminoacyl-tRNA hydrolase [Allomuricauda sp.]MBO6588327.1 aminoacyl-tRNA hydrolase [Allomuricauda sp.]MBO6617952.1 aminoacyl-tRNA hydrolase [Allomuricauda sp.]MBO6643037.1 aminoacyl-tRNA hydrolase [Allomuricauda sp.]MBO6746287.1 aminoacyl-tRNA hydrolase [Allomuricauda sp.]
MLHFIKQLFSSSKQLLQETEPMKKFLIVGLGNIGAEYEDTRHNIGFKVLDFLAEQESFTFESAKLGAVGTFKHKGRSLICLKPSTYMNLSGKAVKYWLDKESVPMENLLVITDDINLPFGTLRLKGKGSDGGHNGLKDIQNVLQTTTYNRFRFGVGSDFGKGQQVDYVLGKWDDDQQKSMPERLEKSADLVRSFVFAGAKNTMNQFNGK